MTDYLRHLAAKNLNLEKGVTPRVPAFFEPAAFAGGAYDHGYYLEQDSFSDEKEASFDSKAKRWHDETEKRIDGISIERTYPESLISRDASTDASGQSPITGRLDGGRRSGIFPPISAEPRIRYAGQRPRSFCTRNSGYILTNGAETSRQIEPQQSEEPQKSELPSSDIAGKTLGVNPARSELELKHREYFLGKSQNAYHSHMHKRDLSGARREPYRRVRWEPAYDHQQDRDSAELSGHPKKLSIQATAPGYDGPEAQRTSVSKFDIYQLEMPEGAHATTSSEREGFQSHEDQNKREYPDNIKRSKKSQSMPANLAHILMADFKMGREKAPDQLDSIFEFSPSSANQPDAMPEKKHLHRDSIIRAAAVKTTSNGSIIDRKSQSDHFMVRISNDAHQKAPRSHEKTIAVPPVLSALSALLYPGPNGINERSVGGMPHQDRTWNREAHPGDRPSPDLSSRNNKMIRVKKGVPDFISRDQEWANILRMNSMTAQPDPSRTERQERQFPTQSNGARSTIQVKIGRIEVRAEKPHHAPSAGPIYKPAAASRLSLDEYLKKRSTGQI